MPKSQVATDFFRETGELIIETQALPRPTLEELQEKFNWIKRIERDTSPTEAMRLQLATVLHKNEKWIDGAEYERRLAPKLNLALGYQQAVWLVEHQDEFPDFMAMLGKVYIDFPGLIVVSSDGYRNYPYLIQLGGRWDLRWDWIDDVFRSSARIAVSGK